MSWVSRCCALVFQSHLAELTRLREQALDAKQVAAAVQAEQYRGKAAGLYEDRLRLTSDGAAQSH